MSIRDVTLVDASVQATATFADAVEALSTTQSPALAVLDEAGRVVGVFSEGDLLRAVFPGYLTELRHTAFLTDDAASLDQLAKDARDRPVHEFARQTEVLSGKDSQIHAAELFLHTEEDALPVVEGDRFLGMLSVSALCRARLARVDTSDDQS
jgi:CBS domain-containing protein